MTVVRKNFQDRVRGLAAVGRCCWPREYERGVGVVLRKDWGDWKKIATICVTNHWVEKKKRSVSIKCLSNPHAPGIILLVEIFIRGAKFTVDAVLMVRELMN